MINQGNVREMTRMAMLESGLGEKELNISTYKKTDYVLLSVLKGIVAGTVCFAAFCGFWFFMTWDNLNQYFAGADFVGFIKKAVFYYIVFMAAYLTLCAVVALKRYKSCRERRKQYLRHLKRLTKRYASDSEET